MYEADWHQTQTGHDINWQDRFRTKLGYPRRLGAEVRIQPIHVWPDPVWKERSVALQCFSWIFERVYRQMQLRTLGVVTWCRIFVISQWWPAILTLLYLSIPYTYPTYNILQLLHPSCWGEPHWTTRYCWILRCGDQVDADGTWLMRAGPWLSDPILGTGAGLATNKASVKTHWKQRFLSFCTFGASKSLGPQV